MSFDDFGDFDLDGDDSSSDSGFGDMDLSGDSQSSSNRPTDGFGGDIDDFTDLNNSVEADKKAVIKTSIICIICAIVFILVIITIVAVVNNIKNKGNEVKEPVPSQSQTVVDNNTNAVSNNKSSNEWKEFTSASGLTFKDEYMDTTFTVTSIRHYLKVVDSESNIQLITKLSGDLAGYIGTYELDIPYSKGSLLSTGNSFSVSVQVGNTQDGKIVIGEIQY